MKIDFSFLKGGKDAEAKGKLFKKTQSSLRRWFSFIIEYHVWVEILVDLLHLKKMYKT